MPAPAIKFAKASLNQQQMIAGLKNSFDYNVEAMAALTPPPRGASGWPSSRTCP